VFRWAAGFGVVSLVAALAPPKHGILLAVLIVWVAAYNGIVTLSLSQLENDSIRTVVRVASIIDGASLFGLLAIFLPGVPAALLAVYPCVLIEMVAFDGVIGGIYGIVTFVVGFSLLKLLGALTPWNDMLLWSAVIAITATSMTFSSQVLLRSGTIDIGAARRDLHAVAPHLSARELEVLRLVAEGCSNAMIASRLNLSENTVKGHVETLLTRFNARNRAEAVAAAGRLDLLEK
jgi:DNA-binding CsgD family transcriptional regulator